jgi:hypothetical protein
MPTLGPCQFIQDEIDNLEQEISDLEDALNEVPPSVRAGLLREIQRLRQQVRRLYTELQSCLRNPAPYALSLDGIEVTQAIQDMNHSVALVATKATVVRVYLSYSLSPAVTVRGELALRRSPSGPSLIVPSANTVVLDPAQVGQLDTKRRNAQLSLNFPIPVDQTADGQLYLSLASVTNASTGVAFDVSHLGATKTVTFVVSAPLRVRILGVRYQYGTPSVTHLPAAIDFGLINSWLQRAYPVAQVISSRAIVDATAATPFGCGDINAQVAAIRALDMSEGADKRTHYFGLVADGGFFMRGCAAGIPSTPDPSTVASGPTGAGNWGWDFDGSYGDWYTGHELGHTFGRLHPGACGESHDDPSYPFTAGQLANADDAFVGFDVGDPVYNLPMVALPGVAWHDVMTYCSYQWLSSYTYQGIRARLVAENGLPAGPSPGPAPGVRSCSGGRPDQRFPERMAMETTAAAQRTLINVVATVNLTKESGHIRFVNPLPQGDLSVADPDSTVILIVKASDGRVLHEYQMGVKLLSCVSPGHDRQGLVDAVLAVDPAARIIDLSIAGHVVDTFQAGGTPPAVRNLKRAPAPHAALALSWDTDAKPEDKHSYTVQVSTDDGKTWQTLAVGLAQPEVALDRNQFHGAKQVQVRVIATDGFTRSVVKSESMALDGQ